MEELDKNDTRGWVGRHELAATLGLQVNRIDVLRKLLPPGAERKVAGKVLIHAATAARVWAEQARKGPKRKGFEPEPEDEGPAESKPLQRKQLAQAKLAEMELARKKRELVPVQEVRALFGFVTASAKDFAEQHGRAFGDAARQAFNEWLDALALQVEKVPEAPK